MATSPDCLFCRIVSREIPAAIVYEDEEALAFRDIRPQAPVHILLIPKKHFARLDEAEEGDKAVLGHLCLLAGRIAAQEGLSPEGFRTVINAGANAGQEVFHLHLHILGGRRMSWPPG